MIAKNDILNKGEKYRQCSVDDNEWICRSCHNAMCRGNIPVQAKANGLDLDFMKMVALPSGKQRCIHGPAVNVPSKLDNVCTLLPRMPSEASMIPLKLKCKLHYKGHYMYNYVRPDKVMTALKWLKLNNPMTNNIF